ncbi:helix-hairpin-helix domain-containing protein [Fulvivirga sp. 29W222]|uniref:Helix-hairpin-helix domain-containing protein n=1 Tax=Fulvivirga marina TaxID=2494733 RepID=A0A937KB09_9BACT|nr:helix-hairpin-helix domain-containing protein [Fulvivirga marina]MBL6445249.1 helix-hairpin-helix domain-containing protein [Fulvivirga marina]
MKLVYFIALALLMLHAMPLPGQNSDIEEDFQSLAEHTQAFKDEEISTGYYETLLLYYSHPLNLNLASVEELRSLFILSEVQISNLKSYINEYGRLLTIYELQAIPGFDIPTIQRLLPFIRVSDDGLQSDNRPLIKRMLSEPNNYILLRYQRTLEKKAGYTKKGNKYAGSPDQLLFKFRVRHAHDFGLGLTIKKDAGEALTFDRPTNRYGADFYSFHFQLQDKGCLKNLVLGDYRIQFGQSLLLAAGFNIGKNPETITTNRKPNLGILPFTSTLESNYFRGFASTYKLSKRINITGFYSRVAQDATPEIDTLISNENFIRSINLSGLHRTSSELAANNQVIQQSAGGNILYQNHPSNLQVGFTMVTDFFSLPIIPADKPYKQFDFHGKHNLGISLSSNYNWQNINLFAEIGQSGNGGIGVVGGLIAHLAPQLQTSVVLRRYERNFRSIHGQAFGESAINQNEQGVYWGLKYQPSRKFILSTYFDRFSFPWLKYRIDAPSNGYEYLTRLSYIPSRKTIFYLQYREQSKARNVQERTSGLKAPLNNFKRSYMINLDHTPHKDVSFKSRVQFSNYETQNQITYGFAMVQDISIDLNKLRVCGRLALFDTDDYDNRQYVYEKDVLYGFSIPPYSGKGTRQYILLQYKATRKINFWIRFARTHYREIESIGSGTDKIQGNIKTDVKFQTRIKF